MAASPYDGLYWETHLPLGLHNMLQGLTKQTSKDPNTPDVWTPSTDREWFSLPRGANSYTVKHSVYTFGDAANFFDEEGKRTLVGNNNLTPDQGEDFDYAQSGYGAQIARNLNPNIFNWLPIAYSSYAFPLNNSVTTAVNRAVTIISGTPGKIFLIGTGLGAVVTSRLYEEFRSGRLVARRSDLLAIYHFGNPLRQAGRVIPNGIPNSGRGMAPVALRLSATEDLIWEFADPADIITTQQDDSKGDWAEAIYNALSLNVTGPDSLLGEIVELVFNPFNNIPALITLFNDFVRQLLSNGGAHNDYQNFYPIAGSRLNALAIAQESIDNIGKSNSPEVITEPVTEVLTINYREPVSVSEISFEVLRNSVYVELWYMDRTGRWRQLINEDASPITLKLSSTEAVSWYKFHAYTYPIVAKAIQYRATRTPDPLVGDALYCIGIKNTLVRRNVYDRSSGMLSMDSEQDALGNVITKTIKDWDAAKAVDDRTTTFWRSAPQPDPDAVVSFYLDMRDSSGNAQMVDKVYIDPVYTGQILNLYYSNDETVVSRKLSPISLVPDDTQQNFRWIRGEGLSDDTSNDSETSLYQCDFSIGPMVSQDCWIGIQWTPDFNSANGASNNPPPNNPVLFEVVPDNTSGTQSWPRIVYDVGAAKIQLEIRNLVGATPLVYTTSTALTFSAGTPLNIVVGWTYSTTNPTVHISVRSDRKLQLATQNASSALFPKKITLDGKIRYTQWRGTLGALVVKQQSYLAQESGVACSENFLRNPAAYCNPEPILLSAKGITPASSLDEAIIGADWTIQEFAAGGTHQSNYSDKEWSPIWANYITERGFLYLPRATKMKHLKLEFTQLTPEPYPVYDQGVKVTYQAYPITITSMQPERQADGLLGAISNIFNAVGSINWLNPSTVSRAVNSIFGRTVEPVQTTLQIGPGYTFNALPNTTQAAIGDSTRTEASTPMVYRRTPMSPYSLVQNFMGTLMGQNQGQTKTLVPALSQKMIEDQTKLTAPAPATPATLPIQGQDWYVFPGQTLRMPASVIEGLTRSQVNTRRNKDRSNRIRFTTTAIHRYETKTVTLDAAMAYFAGIREVQPYVTSYVDYESTAGNVAVVAGSSAEHPEFRFDSYDNSNHWSFVNVNQLDTGPITANSNPYVVKNKGFDVDISNWAATGTWRWDNSEGYSTKNTWQPGVALIYGAAFARANGQTQTLISESIPVTPLENINFSAWVVYRDVSSTTTGKIFVDAIGLSGTTVTNSTIPLGTKMTINNPQGSSVPIYGVRAIHLYGSCQVPTGVNNLRLRLTVNSAVSEGEVWFDDIEMLPAAGIYASAFSEISTKSTFSRVNCEFSDSGLKRSDSMWSLANDNYVSTNPPTVFSTASATGNGTRATITLASRPDFVAGSSITVAGITPSGYNGTWNVFAVSDTAPWTFTYNCTETGTQTVAGTVVENRVQSYRNTMNNTNIDKYALAYYTATIPATTGVRTTAASGTGSVATLTLEKPSNLTVGEPITVSGLVATGGTDAIRNAYNGVYNVSAVSNTAPFTISYPCNATGTQTAAGVVSSTTFPNGTWGDTFGAWADSVISWGTPSAQVAIQIDPNMVYDKKRVVHFYRAGTNRSGPSGEAGIMVRQETNLVPGALFRICALWNKPRKNNNTIKLRLRRVSGDTSGGIYPNGYVYQETIPTTLPGRGEPGNVGYWYTHQSRWSVIPEGQDQTYTVEMVLDGNDEDDIFLSDLWVEVAQVRYHVQLGGGTPHDVTPLAHTNNCTVGVTVPVTTMQVSTTIYGDRSFAYGCAFTPLYLK